MDILKVVRRLGFLEQFQVYRKIELKVRIHTHTHPGSPTGRFRLGHLLKMMNQCCTLLPTTSGIFRY